MTANFKATILRQPFHLFLLAAILLFLFSFLAWRNSMDFHIHDTYFVISTILVIWATAVFVLLVWAVYKLTSKVLWKRFLTWFHIIATLSVLVLVLTANLWHDKLLPPVKREFVSFETFRQRETSLFVPMVILFIAGQLAFVLNILGGLTKRLIKKR